MPGFRLKSREIELDLPSGELTIGRGSECFLRINDELVSRRHARLLVSTAAVFFEDLGSRNGSKVNGAQVAGAIELRIGDTIEIGTQVFQLLEGAAPIKVRPASTTAPNLRPCRVCKRLLMAREATCPQCGAGQPGRDEMSEEPTKSMTSFALLLGLGDKMLALGRAEEAEKMLGPRLRELAARVTRGETLLRDEVAEALRRAVRLATATRRADWYSWVFDFARLTDHPLDDGLLDELHAHMMVHKPTAAVALQAYLDSQSGQDPASQLRRRRLEALSRFCR